MINIRLYACLTTKLTPIKDVRLVYARDEQSGIFISIFYDELSENYSKTETKIFDAYLECCDSIKDRAIDVLVMIYKDAIDIPKGSVILLKRKQRGK